MIQTCLSTNEIFQPSFKLHFFSLFFHTFFVNSLFVTHILGIHISSSIQEQLHITVLSKGGIVQSSLTSKEIKNHKINVKSEHTLCAVKKNIKKHHSKEVRLQSIDTHTPSLSISCSPHSLI